ncbi:MAG TPA: VOC family protein [Wenzhouxiangellaceae bacterium]|nr:VOC family protein [Wenzhouxiangellaceae bacterium]
MPNDSSHFRHGDFCRVDLNARDPDAARVFYSGLFGWTGEFAGRAGDAGPYERFFLDGLLVAGMGRMSDEMRHGGSPSVWVSYIRVDDVDAAVQAAEGLGATIQVPATSISEAGRIAFIQDPTGASVAFWEAGLEPGAEATKVPGTFCWNELVTPDLDGAQAFYAELLGWTGYVNPHSPAPYRIIENAGRSNGGILKMTEEWGDAPPHWIVYFAVVDAEDAAARVRALGGSVHHGPFDTAAGRLVVCQDNQGAGFHVLELAGRIGD